MISKEGGITEVIAACGAFGQNNTAFAGNDSMTKGVIKALYKLPAYGASSTIASFYREIMRGISESRIDYTTPVHCVINGSDETPSISLRVLRENTPPSDRNTPLGHYSEITPRERQELKIKPKFMCMFVFEIGRGAKRPGKKERGSMRRFEMITRTDPASCLALNEHTEEQPTKEKVKVLCKKKT